MQIPHNRMLVISIFFNGLIPQYINQQTMRQLIEGQKKRITTVNEQMMTRDNKTKEVKNRYQEKDFTMCYDKRVVAKTESGIETFPYGY